MSSVSCKLYEIDYQSLIQNQQCRVCEEPAAGFHFGAFTCDACMSFFGRTCNNQSVIQECKNNYRCTVDKKNRTACKACRLKKCLMVGMSKSGSRYGRRSNWFKIHCLMQKQQPKAVPQPPPLLLPHLPPSSSTASISWPPPKDHPLFSPIPTKPHQRGSPSPSPSHLSFSSETSSKTSPQSPPMTEAGPVSPVSLPSSLLPSSLYPFPPPLPFLSSSPFPFYRLSPPLAGNPFLANYLLFSMAGKPPVDRILKEQCSLLSQCSSTLLSSQLSKWIPPTLDPRPMDLTVVRPQARRPDE